MEHENPKPRWSVLIERAEIDRERGKTEQALEALESIRSEASAAGDAEMVGLATAHIVLCYKHLYQNTANKLFLSKMETEIDRALALPIQDQHKAVFWLRRCDIESERGDFSRAEAFCKRACDLVEKNGGAEAEYLGHLAEVKTMIGKFTEAENLFTQAISILNTTRDLRPFHRVTLKCGLLARQTRLEMAQGRLVATLWCFLRGYRLAWVYKVRYGMGQRVLQYHAALRQIFRRIFLRHG